MGDNGSYGPLKHDAIPITCKMENKLMDGNDLFPSATR
jgi:hypothetical protein